jgi:hypothetical protein
MAPEARAPVVRPLLFVRVGEVRHEEVAVDRLEQPRIACPAQIEELELDVSVATGGRRAPIVSRARPNAYSAEHDRG